MDALAEIRNIYFDECDEFIGLLEGHLAALGEGGATAEDINGAFRAVHSIKGGAGAFGLTDLVEFAHLFEACLDALRSGRLAVEDTPIDVMLQAGDVLVALVAAAREDAPPGSCPVDPALIAALQGLAGGKAGKPKANSRAQVAAQVEATVGAAKAQAKAPEAKPDALPAEAPAPAARAGVPEGIPDDLADLFAIPEEAGTPGPEPEPAAPGPRRHGGWCRPVFAESHLARQ